jgi:hypothetical protein
MRIGTFLAVLALSATVRGQVGDTTAVTQPSQPPAVPEERVGNTPLPERPDQALNKPTNDALDKSIEKVRLHDEPLATAIDLLADQAHVNIVVNWKALEAGGVERTTKVNLDLSHLTIRKVLDVLVSQIATPMASFKYLVWNNHVVVSTKEDLQSTEYQVVKVFDLRPLFADVELDSPEAADLTQQVVDTVKTTVEPDSWRENGGTVGVARILNAQLIVNQTLDNHDQIAILLTELTKTPAHTTRAYDVQDLVKDDPATKAPALIAAIQTNCGRQTWRGQGGKTSTIAFFDGKLYVTTKPPVHDQIENLLKLIRQK